MIRLTPVHYIKSFHGDHMMAHKKLSLLHTHSPVTIPHYGKNEPSLPSYGQSSSASVTPAENYTPGNNPPKPVPCIPIEPN